MDRAAGELGATRRWSNKQETTMRIMSGWTIDMTDVAIGVGLLLALIVVGITLRVARQIAQFDLSVDESRECFCDGTGHEPEPQQCADCGRYVELGVGD